MGAGGGDRGGNSGFLLSTFTATAMSGAPPYRFAEDAPIHNACGRTRVERIRDLARKLGRRETAIRRRWQRLRRGMGRNRVRSSPAIDPWNAIMDADGCGFRLSPEDVAPTCRRRCDPARGPRPCDPRGLSTAGRWGVSVGRHSSVDAKPGGVRSKGQIRRTGGLMICGGSAGMGGAESPAGAPAPTYDVSIRSHLVSLAMRTDRTALDFAERAWAARPAQFGAKR